MLVNVCACRWSRVHETCLTNLLKHSTSCGVCKQEIAHDPRAMLSLTQLLCQTYPWAVLIHQAARAPMPSPVRLLWPTPHRPAHTSSQRLLRPTSSLRLLSGPRSCRPHGPRAALLARGRIHRACHHPAVLRLSQRVCHHPRRDAPPHRTTAACRHLPPWRASRSQTRTHTCQTCPAHASSNRLKLARVPPLPSPLSVSAGTGRASHMHIHARHIHAHTCTGRASRSHLASSSSATQSSTFTSWRRALCEHVATPPFSPRALYVR